MVLRRALRTTGPARPGPGAADPLRINWANVLASFADAVIVVDLACAVSFLNQAGESLVGVSTGQARGRALKDLLAGDVWLLAMVEETLTLGHGHRRGEGLLSSLDAPIPVAATVSPLFDALGALEGATVLLRDLRARRNLEELGRYADRSSGLELLSAGLAHEIKNPLGAIKGAAQLLVRNPAVSGDTLREHVQIIVREVDRLSRLLDELRDLSQPAPLRAEAVNIHRVLKAVLDLARQSPDWKTTRLLLRFDPSLPDVLGDEGKLVQVFLNLVINAVQAMGGAGTLAISTRMVTDYHVRGTRTARGRFLSVDIEDTGPGLGASDPGHLFAPFFTTKPGGSGLGLAVCQQIVGQHAGHVWLRDRRRGIGAVAQVMLPLAPSANPP
jgi:two-component system nitrogen regulation sensor histidine kinase GlnL